MTAISGSLSSDPGLRSPVSGLQPGYCHEKIRFPFLRTGEPINPRGEPLGGAIRVAALVPVPEPARSGSGKRALAVFGHENGEITVVEMAREPGASCWRHDVASPRNRKFAARSRIPMDGARIVPGANLHRRQETGGPLGSVRCMAALPWGNVLCGEEWCVEVNPLTGLAIRRPSLGKVQPLALEVLTRPGEPVVVVAVANRLEMASDHSPESGVRSPESEEMAGSIAPVYELRTPDCGPMPAGQLILFRFVSHQLFDARRIDANLSSLVIGELSVADPDKGAWVPLTKDLSPQQWFALVDDPFSGSITPDFGLRTPDCDLISSPKAGRLEALATQALAGSAPTARALLERALRALKPTPHASELHLGIDGDSHPLLAIEHHGRDSTVWAWKSVHTSI